MVKPRRRFEQELVELEQLILRMGAISEDMLSRMIQALKERNTELAEETVRMDDQVDALNLEIETICIKLIATQQPQARDLRRIIAALKIAGDVERVADYAVDICLVGRELADKPLFKPLEDIPKMQEIVKRMLHETLDAFVTRDLDLVYKMIADDEEVDTLYENLYVELKDFMKQDPSLVDQAVPLILITRYLERIADHITNIGERVFYVETGELKELHV
ncbi:MAG: phosphate signaling complex protein PhoU [Firmicutes bacterium]|jgi:phosphate transport system protein|nr:phosphate signaling complex protein PhoU [Bacillota bacterium]HXL04341.1 phosphate signaling complex protein PhoU [Bacillota bacterium]